MTKKVTESKSKKEKIVLSSNNHCSNNCSNNHWTKNEKKILVQCLNSGKSAVETAAKLGRTVNAVWCMKYKMIKSGEIKNAKSFRDHRTKAPVSKLKKVATKTFVKSVFTAKKKK